VSDRTDFDRCFENAFCGSRQMMILHKHRLGDDVWHVCTIDSNDFYHEGRYRLDRKEWTFTRVPTLADAAPDLLAACEQTEHNLRQGALCEEDLLALRAAIRKAKGE